MTEPLWTPSAERLKSARLGRFMAEVRAAWSVEAADYGTLHAWSIAEPALFWRSMWDFAGIIGDGPGEHIVIDGERMPGARWFPDAKLNYAENLLRRRDEADALVFWGEERVRRRLSFAEMHDQVSRMAQALAARGVRQGDRVAGYLPNMPETIVSALAAASLGAVWSSCSSDFGTRGVLDRFGQIAPKVLIAADGYFYGGKTFDRRPQVREILAELPTVEHVIVGFGLPRGRDYRRRAGGAKRGRARFRPFSQSTDDPNSRPARESGRFRRTRSRPRRQCQIHQLATVAAFRQKSLAIRAGFRAPGNPRFGAGDHCRRLF